MFAKEETSCRVAFCTCCGFLHTPVNVRLLCFLYMRYFSYYIEKLYLKAFFNKRGSSGLKSPSPQSWLLAHTNLLFNLRGPHTSVIPRIQFYTTDSADWLSPCYPIETKFRVYFKSNLFIFSGPFFTYSRRGNPILTIEGHRFCRGRPTSLKNVWRCSYVNRGCRAVIHTLINENVMTKCYNIHNHWILNW